MSSNQFSLLKDRRFLPMFITQACGCFNDNLLKGALIMLFTFKLSLFSTSLSSEMLVALAPALFVFPRLIFSSLAGQIADKYNKARVAIVVKAAELLIISISVYGFYYHSLDVLLISLTLMGIHATFFGPVKYSILPEHLEKKELITANSLVEGATFLTILVGTLLGGLAVDGIGSILFIMFFVGIIGFLASLYILPSTHVDPEIKINWNIIQETYLLIKGVTVKRQIFRTMLGISWFWFLGACILTLTPPLTKNILACDVSVANLFMATFSIAVAFGSGLCNRIFATEISTKYLFITLLGISIAGIDLYFASNYIGRMKIDHLRDVFKFLGTKNSWRIMFDLFVMSCCLGIYAVPLYASIQHYSAPAFRSRIVAACNLIDSTFMIGSSLFIMAMSTLGFSVTNILLIVFIMNIFVSIYIYRILPVSETIHRKLTKKIWDLIFGAAG